MDEPSQQLHRTIASTTTAQGVRSDALFKKSRATSCTTCRQVKVKYQTDAKVDDVLTNTVAEMRS
jgi:hypothetical protein